jgi:3-hydroxyacyl-CoA dehydrogenase
MHFFNPVLLMRLVEIIPGLKTAAWVSEALSNLARRMAREPVLCTDSPAFLVNHVGRAFVPEAQRLLGRHRLRGRHRSHSHGRPPACASAPSRLPIGLASTSSTR